MGAEETGSEPDVEADGLRAENSAEERVREMYSRIRYPGLSSTDNEAYARHRRCMYALQGLDVDNWFANKLVLDAGCGTGEETLYLASLGPEKVIGIDTSEGSLEHARRAADDHGIANVEFLHISVLDETAFGDGEFDFVSSLGCIHHTPGMARAFRNLCRVVRPGGYLNTFIYNSYGHLAYNLQCAILDRLVGTDIEARVRLGRRLFEWGRAGRFEREGVVGSAEARLYDKYGVLYRESIGLARLLGMYRAEGFCHVGSFPMYWSDLIDAYEARQTPDTAPGGKRRVLQALRTVLAPRTSRRDWTWRRRVSMQGLLLLLGFRDYGSSCRILGKKNLE